MTKKADTSAPLQAPLTLPTQVEPSDLAYHAQIIDQVRNAQAASQSWGTYLSRKYQLGQTDLVNADGAITRAG